MSANSFGKLFKWTTFGESHGPSLGVVIDGCPAGVEFDESLLLANLRRRRPGQQTADGKVLVSERSEDDYPIIMSGVFQGKTLGTPIAIRIDNQDQKSQHYDHIKSNPRIGHADDVWLDKFSHVDHRGGGRASARETANWVIAGTVAQMLCRRLCPELNIFGYVEQIGDLRVLSEEATELNLKKVEEFPLRFPSARNNQQAQSMIMNAKEQGESYGGILALVAKEVPRGLGQPVFNKLKSDLARAIMTVNACTGVEIGEGFAVATQIGTELHTDMKSQSYGGIRGGISTGEEIFLRAAFKPTSSIGKTAKEGRHDPCILPRAVPVVEALAWAVIADHLLWMRLDRIS